MHSRSLRECSFPRTRTLPHFRRSHLAGRPCSKSVLFRLLPITRLTPWSKQTSSQRSLVVYLVTHCYRVRCDKCRTDFPPSLHAATREPITQSYLITRPTFQVQALLSLYHWLDSKSFYKPWGSRLRFWQRLGRQGWLWTSTQSEYH